MIDEFQNIARNYENFSEEIVSYVERLTARNNVLTIQVSSHVGWVENRMIASLGILSQHISDVFKVKELEFRYVREYFPWYTIRQCIEVYAILGGVPGWWQHFAPKRSLKENVCRNLLDDNGFLHTAAEGMIAEELREPAVYNTLLEALAMGRYKLNELYLHTGFSRAKISVYLRNLMEMDLVEKVFSMEEEGRNDTRKGLYRIKNHYLHFYYTYLYRAEDLLFNMTPERYYNRYIFPTLEDYTQECFREICRQHVEWCSSMGEFPIAAIKIGSWFGKMGTIDIMVKDEAGKTVLALYRGKRMGMLAKDYREFFKNIQQAKIKADYIWLYVDRFEEEIVLDAQRKENITLIDTRTL